MKLLFFGIAFVVYFLACQAEVPEKCRRGLIHHHCRRGGYQKSAFYFDPLSSSCRPYHYFCGRPDFKTVCECIDTCNPLHKNELPLFCYRLVDNIHCGGCGPQPRHGRRTEFFSYSPLDGKCKRFTTRCHNLPITKRANVFRTMAECQAACPEVDRDEPQYAPHPGCLKPRENYKCSHFTDHQRTYYTFNQELGACEQFVSRCNLPNNPEVNVFKSIEQCHASCTPGEGLKDMPSECYKEAPQCDRNSTAASPRSYWTYVSADGRCEQFASRCELETDVGNNVFESEDDCDTRCNVLSPTGQQEDICSFRREPGPCRASYRRYYYDINKGECRKFLYGGCDGNANNFKTIEECRNACMAKPVDEAEPEAPKCDDEDDDDDYEMGKAAAPSE